MVTGGEAMMRKKILAVWVVVLAIVAGAGVFFSYLLPKFMEKSDGRTMTEYIDPYNYFYEENPLPLEGREEYADYIDLDRYIYVKEGNITRAIAEGNESSFTEEELFFKDYFAALEAGDADAYNALLTKACIENGGAHAPFTPQMVYDRRIERVSETHAGGYSTYSFNVYYKFYHNDGTFRSDVYSDAERGLRIVLDTSEGRVKIASVQYFTS